MCCRLASGVVRTYAWMVLLGRNGVFNRMLSGWGSPASIPMLHNFTGVLIAWSCPAASWSCRLRRGAARRPAVVAARGAGRLELAHFWRFTSHYLNGSSPLVLLFVLSLALHPPALLARPGHHDRRADRAAGARGAELAVRLGPLGGPLVATFVVYALAQRVTQPEART